MRPFLLAGVSLTLLTLSSPRLHAVDWPPPPWSPKDGLDFPVAGFRASNLTVDDVLRILDNECGLVFGFADQTDADTRVTRVSFEMRNTTARAIVEELQRRSPDYSFESIDDVVTVVPKETLGRRPAFLTQRVPSFEVTGEGPVELEARLKALLQTLPGFPSTLSPIPSIGPRDTDTPRVSFRVENVRVADLLAKAAAAVDRSWVFMDRHERRFTAFMMGRAWISPVPGSYKIVRAPGAQREPTQDEPPTPEVVRQRMGASLQRARQAQRDVDAAIGELAALIDDYHVRDSAPQQVREAIQLIGDLRVEAGAPVLIRHLLRGQPGLSLRDLTAQWLAQSNDPDKRRVAADAYRCWVDCYPVVRALERIGRPAAPHLVGALADDWPDHQDAGHGVESKSAVEGHEAAVILLCESLKRILGADEAMARLGRAAEDEKDPVRTKRLRAAADRIFRGFLQDALGEARAVLRRRVDIAAASRSPGGRQARARDGLLAARSVTPAVHLPLRRLEHQHHRQRDEE